MLAGLGLVRLDHQRRNDGLSFLAPECSTHSLTDANNLIQRKSKHKGSYTLAGVAELAGGAIGTDKHGYRAEFIKLVKKAKELKNR